MSPDTLLVAGIALVRVATAYWGLYVTFHPATNSRSQRRHTLAFWALGIIGVALVAWSGFRNDRTQNAMQGELTQIRSGIDKLLLGSSKPLPVARTLTDSDRAQLTEAIAPFAQTSVKVIIGCLAIAGPRPCNYAQQWKTVLESAGWKVNDQILNQIYMPPFAGVHIPVSSQTTPGAGLLQNAFNPHSPDAMQFLASGVTILI